MKRAAENADAGAGRKARVTVGFRGVRDGEVMPVSLRIGDVLTGELAEIGVDMGCAEWMGKERQTKQPAPKENKATAPTFSDGPRNESASSQPAGRAKGKTTSTKSKRTTAKKSGSS